MIFHQYFLKNRVLYRAISFRNCFSAYKLPVVIFPVLTFLAILPGLAICYAVFRIDKYEREPAGPLLLCLGAGVLLTAPAMEIEKWAFEQLAPYDGQFIATFLMAFAAVALNEEIWKYIALRTAAFPWSFFNEPLDGIVYAVMIAMGFASVENIFYAYRFGLETVLTRAFSAVPAHAVFAVVQGYYMGLAKFDLPNRQKLLRKGLIMSILLHGAYDFLIIQHWSSWLLVLGSCCLYLSILYCTRLVRIHLEGSPFKRHETNWPDQPV